MFGLGKKKRARKKVDLPDLEAPPAEERGSWLASALRGLANKIDAKPTPRAHKPILDPGRIVSYRTASDLGVADQDPNYPVVLMHEQVIGWRQCTWVEFEEMRTRLRKRG